MRSVIGAMKAFHEQPAEVRAQVYRRETGTGVSYLSNVDLFTSKAASWRDTLQVIAYISFGIDDLINPISYCP
jgi:hypothetical protein